MVPDLPNNYSEADQSLYRDIKNKIPACIIGDEKNHHHQRKSAYLQQSLSSCMSGLTFEDSWSVDLVDDVDCEAAPSPHSHVRGGPAAPLRGRRSLLLRSEVEQDDFSKNRFDAVLQPTQQRQQHQPNLCKPPTRRASSGCSVATSDSSTAYKTFNDSSVISVETELLEQDPVPMAMPNSNPCFPPTIPSRNTKINRRLTPTLEVPEEQDQSNWGEEMLLDMPSQHTTTTTTTAQMRDGRPRNKPHTPPRQKFSRDSITLDAAMMKPTAGHWGVKSSLTLDSALFDESALNLAKPEDDDDEDPSKRTSWAVGSSLTLATFEDSLPLIRSAGHGQHEYQEERNQHHQGEESSIPISNNNPDLLCQEMNRLRFSSHSAESRQNNATSLRRTMPCALSSISPCVKPTRTQSTNTNDSTIAES